MTCVIIDDEPLALDLLQSYVERTPFLTLKGRYSSAVQALADSASLADVDLMFLDIQMPELSGLEFSKAIDPRTRIIFTTAFSQYAVDSYKVNALDYLLKPISYTDFLTAAIKAKTYFEQQSALSEAADDSLRFIYVKSDYKLVQIELSKILYVEGLKDYVKIWLDDRADPILSIISMKTMEEKLPARDFIRVHRSFIVQKSKITTIDRSRIVFGKQYIPISDSYRAEVQSYIDSLSV